MVCARGVLATAVLLMLPVSAAATSTVLAKSVVAVASDVNTTDVALYLLQGRTQRHLAVVSSTPLGADAHQLCSDDLWPVSSALEPATDNYFWTNKNGDAFCSGASPWEPNVDVGSGPTWSFKDNTSSLVSTHPCIDDEKAVYLLHCNGMLRKFSSTGKLLWANDENYLASKGKVTFVNDHFAVGNPALMHGTIYVGSVDGYVTAANMSTGQTLWRLRVAKAAGADSWSITAQAGLVLVAMRTDGWPTSTPDFGGNNQVVALDSVSGEVVWRWTAPMSSLVYNFLGAVVDVPLSVVFSTIDGQPYRLRLCDGALLWKGEHPEIGTGEKLSYSTGGLIAGPNGNAYVTSNVVRADGTKVGVLSAYRLDTGRRMWSKRQEMEATAAPSIGALGPDERLSVVIALGAGPGLPLNVGHQPPSPLPSEVLAFDADSGEPTGWRYSPPPREVSSAEGDYFPDHVCLPDAWSNGAIDGTGTYYVGHMSGNIFAIQDTNGDGVVDEASGEVARFYGGRCYQGSPGLAPGMLVSTPCDGVHVWLSPSAH